MGLARLHRQTFCATKDLMSREMPWQMQDFIVSSVGEIQVLEMTA